MAKALLPSLKKGHNVQDPTIGQWDARTADELDKISKGLDVSQAETQINSIPDVWARPLLFEMALFDADHTLHKQTLGEWRGLLAMLALKDIKNLDVLITKKIEIKKQDNKQNLNDNQIGDNKSEIVPKAKNYVFLKALESLIPEKSLEISDTSKQELNTTSWKHLYLFLFKNGGQTRPIGLTSPTTLVITSTYYFNHIIQNKVPWFDGKILLDPINFLSKIEKEAMAGWLKSLETNLINHPHQKDTDIWGKISGLLTNFIAELNAVPKYVEGDSLGIEPVSGIFYYLDKPAKKGERTSSDVSLVSSAERNPLTPMLLVDKDIATQWGDQPKNIAVWDSATLADIPSNGVISRNKIGSHNVSGADLWKPEELFTERLFIISSKNAFSGAKREIWSGTPEFNNQPISVILPIKSKLLEYLDEESLLQKLKFQKGANGEIIVQLDLELGTTSTNKLYTAKKIYTGNEIISFNQIPILEVFPNFNNANWKAYYVAYSADDPNFTFQIEPHSSYVIEKNAGKDSKPPEFERKFEAAVEKSEIKIKNNQKGVRKIWRLKSFPNVLVCKAKDENNKEQDAGLLILDSKVDELKSGNQEFTVGVDFGASGTSVFYNSSNDKEPQPLKFENRKLSVTSLTGTQESQLFDFFFPPRDFEIPVLSIFQDFNNNKDKYLTVINGHTYYIEDNKLTFMDSDKKSEKVIENIYTELKWKSNIQQYAEAFLAQICLQTAAELIQKKASAINWKFSYPTAFSVTQLGIFEPIWDNIIKETELKTGIKSVSFSQMTESVAAAQFFRSPPTNAKTQQGTVFVDIGSSTSDVSVWQNGELLWQVSLLFAGQDLFLDYLQKNPAVLNQLGISIADNSHFYAQIDAALRKDGETIFANLKGGGFDDLKQHLAVGLCGLFYYIGLGINCLQQGNFYEKPEMPDFYFAGNGSKMFRWLINGQTWGNNRLTKLYKSLFESVFTKALDTDLNGFFELNMSELPKKEAAFGLVCDIDLKDEEKCKKVFAGENFIENNVEYSWNEALDKERLTDSLQTPAKLEKLSEFIEQFNNFAANSEGLLKKYKCDERKLSSVRGKLDNDLADLARQNNEQVVVQPIFILALKHLLND